MHIKGIKSFLAIPDSFSIAAFGLLMCLGQNSLRLIFVKES